MALTAISPTGVGTAWKYPTQSTAGVGISGILSANSGPINTPLMFEPGPELTGNHYQLWIIATGALKDWGGCEVHIALVGDPTTSFGYIGKIYAGSIQGELTAPFASGSDPDTGNTISVDVTESRGQIIAGTNADADAYLPLAYIEDSAGVFGELVAYSTATLTGSFNYDLDSYIRRGAFGSTVGAHSSGADFALAYAAFVHSYPAHLVGTTIELKFPSFNGALGKLEDISTVPAYRYTLTGNGVRGLKCRTLTAGASTTLSIATDYLLIVAKAVGSATLVNGPAGVTAGGAPVVTPIPTGTLASSSVSSAPVSGTVTAGGAPVVTPIPTGTLAAGAVSSAPVSGAFTASPTGAIIPDGTRFEISDMGNGGLGDADTNPITFRPAGGVLVAGLASYVFRSRGGAFVVTYCNSTGQWVVT
jgi:hypothetical protein